MSHGNLRTESGFQKIYDHYIENKDRPFHDWLSVTNIFPRPGKQGLVGIVTSKVDTSVVYVFKLSQDINYLIQHEYAVLKDLDPIADYCPHFCRGVGIVTAKVDPAKKRKGNPFEIPPGSKAIEKDILLMQYLPNSCKLFNYIISSKISDAVIHSTVKQVLLAVSIAQEKKNFSHYDLHSNNVMMRECDPDLVFLYVLSDTDQFCVPTYGHYPVIIDFGFSYSGGMEGDYLWQTLNHTDIGFMSDRFDSIADPKLFLVTVSDELKENRNSQSSRVFKKLVKTNYKPLSIDWDSGWDNTTKKCATDAVLKSIDNINISKTFSKYEYCCMDIIISLIILPLEKQSHADISTSYSAFATEFAKIEKEITSPLFCIYILKGIVDIARLVRADYLNPSTRELAVSYFRKNVKLYVDTLVKFCSLKDIHYEKLLCGLFCFTKNIEGILYKAIKKRMIEKEKEYAQLSMKRPEEILCALFSEIPEKYVFSEKTKVCIINNVTGESDMVKMKKEWAKDLNEFESISWGCELWDRIRE